MTNQPAAINLDALKTTLQQHGQEHVLAFWDELGPEQQTRFAEQLAKFDYGLVSQLFSEKESGDKWAELAARAEVPPAITLADFRNSESYQKAYDCGCEALRAGKVGMILPAGGQGSRLGFEHPKGMFPIGPVSNRSLYQMLIEKIIGRAKQFETSIPMYVMTSPPTHEESSQYLAENDNFGLGDDLKLFCQGVMPAVDHDGKLILADKDRLFESPDGHGGTLAALKNSGCLADMAERGIEHVFYGQVDNPMIQVCDPALIGYHLDSGSEMSSQVVRKLEPLQKVGNVVSVDGTVQIIEYSDLPAEFAKQTNEDGSLKIWAGSIAVHIFETSFLNRTVAQADALPFHRANKKVPFVNSNGKLVQPTEPNAIKFERFIFDLLPWAKNAIVCEVDPAEGFCAVKNAPPAASETPDHVKQAISDLHTKWLVAAGAEVASGATVEVSPLFAVDENQLKDKVTEGQKFEGSVYLN